MSDCSTLWKLPKRADMEPGVLYMPSLDVDGVREIDAKGVRFEQVLECEMTRLDIGDEIQPIDEYIMHCENCHHEFGYVQYDEDGWVWMSEKPDRCPRCGARVKESAE